MLYCPARSPFRGSNRFPGGAFSSFRAVTESICTNLRTATAQSGGRVFNSGNDIAAEVAACVSDTDAFYSVSIGVSPGECPNGYHALEVKVDKPN